MYKKGTLVKGALVKELDRLEGLLESIKNSSDKLSILDQQEGVQAFIESSPHLEAFFVGLEPLSQIALKSVIAIGQGPFVLRIPDELEDKADKLHLLLAQLLEVERFYDTIGGIIGYQAAIIHLLCGEDKASSAHYLEPSGRDFQSPSSEVDRALLWGVEKLDQMAEIYPVGGAGDRLGLIDPDTGQAIPAACLDYLGRSLLEGLIRDLAGREYLHFRLFGKRIEIPIALMTSEEKHNEDYIRAICEEKQYFGRSKENIIFFSQCLVPQVTINGDWVVSEPLELSLKPGGHGAIWKLMSDHKVFDFLRSKGAQKGLIRQINNPIAGTDTTLLAFAGVGLKEDRAFGFCACERKVGSAEGCDVLFEEKRDEEWCYGLTNIEYVAFEKHGIKDAPKEEGSLFSKFPSNTNILFCDLEKMERVTRVDPIPGKLINMKKETKTLDGEGNAYTAYAGRLESTMQNIADHITYQSKERLEEVEKRLPTYLVYTDRQKTISVTKNAYIPDQDPHETPQGAYFDLLANTRTLFTHYCKVKMPPLKGEGIPFHILYHPALGPTFSIIGQKIQGGKVAHGSELILEIAELSWSNVTLDGSLQILATHPLGEGASVGGRCVLHNCQIQNPGIDPEGESTFWRHSVKRHGSLQIEIEGNGEFVAEGVVFKGAQKIVVPDGMRIVARMRGGKILLEKGLLSSPRSLWTYEVGEDRAIRLRKATSKAV